MQVGPVSLQGLRIQGARGCLIYLPPVNTVEGCGFHVSMWPRCFSHVSFTPRQMCITGKPDSCLHSAPGARDSLHGTPQGSGVRRLENMMWKRLWQSVASKALSPNFLSSLGAIVSLTVKLR